MIGNVLVVGAGPVGLAMAAELARYGIPVRIFDRSSQRTDKSKALVVWSRTLELIDRMGCTASFLDAGYKVTAANIVAGTKQIGHVTFDGVASPYPFALMLPQSETERLLEQHLNACGVKVERSVELTSFVTTDNGIISTLRHPDGSEETVNSSWLIGCDGAHSTVRHQLGMTFVGDTLPSDWILADVHLTGVPNPHELYIAWHSDGILAIFPISQTRYRVIADIGNTSTGNPSLDPTLQDVQSLLDKRGPGNIVASSPVWLSAFHINERKVADYQAGRVFLAGDAAHIHSPAGGQGMNTGIQDACNLAWKLALVSRGICSAEPLLASYTSERSAVGELVLKDAGRLTAVGLMKGEIQQSIRNHIASIVFGFSHILRTMADTMTEVSIGYSNSPLNLRGRQIHNGPAVGERAPIREYEPPVGAGNSPRFALFADPGDDQPASLLARYPDLLEPALRTPFHPGGLWLVRPDGYVVLAAQQGDWDQVAILLDRIV